MAAPNPIRILHVFGGMNRGGAETGFMEFLRHIDRTRFKMDFLVHTAHQCHFDDEIRALGSQVIPCPHTGQPLTYARRLSRILRTAGPYDILHSHVDHFSGFVLRIGAHNGVRVRIAQNHSENRRDPKQLTAARRLYYTLTEHWLARYATLGIAVSSTSAAALFGAHWKSDPRIHVLHYGMDPGAFRRDAERSSVRAEWDVPQDAVVVGHVGSLLPVKNHHFIIETFAAFLEDIPSAHLVLAGVGPLMAEVKAFTQSKGIAARVHFLGLCSDIPRVLSALDVFLFPSRYEGAPLAVLEAQLAGIPCVLSDTITHEIDLKIGLVRYVDLKAGSDVWVDHLKTSLVQDKPTLQARARALYQAEFDIDQQVSLLQNIYEHALA